ncbi:MAG: hypothetical protein JXA25_14965 [Anaerolineales bacterium]|nr:hypothetical protein [Anaerolineales bacterium]
MVFGSCPDCGVDLAVGLEPFLGQQITCLNCGAMLQVTSTEPISVDWSDHDLLEYEEEDDGRFEEENDDFKEVWRRTRHQRAREDR